MNLRHRLLKLEIRRNFFTQRVTDKWKQIPSMIKSAGTVKKFKKCTRTTGRTIDISE